MKALKFNQDATCCVVANDTNSVSIYNCDPFGRCFEFDDDDDNKNSDSISRLENQSSGSCGNYIVEMLFSTSLIAVANRNKDQWQGKGKKLKIVNTKRKSTICELVFPHEVVDVVMNRKRMCILLESDQIFIYDISCMRPLETIDLWEESAKNLANNGALDAQRVKAQLVQQGENSDSTKKRKARRNSIRSKLRPRISLSNDDRSILCYTCYDSSKSKPDTPLLRNIMVYDALNIKPINYLTSVHKGNIACLTTSFDGKLVATASEKGTIVRVFSTGADNDFHPNDSLFCEFRRGTRPCNLYQLLFDRNTNLLGCVGDTDTIHIFKIPNGESNNDIEEQISSYESLKTSHISSETPKQFANYLTKRIRASIPNQNLQRDFAHIEIDESVRHCIGFPDEFVNQVYVAGDDGRFQVYTFPSGTGECVLTKTGNFV